MRERKNARLTALVVVLVAILAIAGCVPGGQIPQTGGTAVPQGTQGNARTGDSSQQEGNPGNTIPQNGPIAATPNPGTNVVPSLSGPLGPQISVSQAVIAPGDEIVITGQAFTPDQTVQIYLGDVGSRQSSFNSQGQSVTGNQGQGTTGSFNQATAVPGQSNNQGQGSSTLGQGNLLGSIQADSVGQFFLHVVLPNPLPQEAVYQGQLMISAVDQSGNQVANTVVEVGGFSSQGTAVPGQSGGQATQAPFATQSSGANGQGSTGNNQQGQVDLGQLGFDFRTIVLPLLNQALGTNYTMNDLVVNSIQATTWPNGCLGLAQAGENCTQQTVPGYQILVTLAGQKYEIRTGQYGIPVRIMQSVQ